MMKKPHESAVSEVISVVLVVALTVILAAIVAAYMFGMIPSLPTSHTVALTATQVDPDNIVVVYHGGPDQRSLTGLNITWPKGHHEVHSNPEVGTVYRLVNRPLGTDTNVTAEKDHIVVTGIFAGNIQQVVLDTFV
jgi:hypothetical protein